MGKGTKPKTVKIVRAGEPPKRHHRVVLAQAMVAQIYDVPVDELAAGSKRDLRVSFARHVAMYLAHVACGMSLAEVGSAFCRDRTTAAHACEKIEEMRENPAVDMHITEIETVLRDTNRIERAL